MTALQQVVATLEALPTTAFLVLDQGQLMLDYGATTAPSYLASARKSVLSVLYGTAVADGQIRLDATLDELGIDDIGGLLPQERRATVRDLLTSSSGVYHPPATVAGEQDAPARGSQPPGALFYYNNWDFNALGTIFERCTGRSVFDALAEDLAAPLAKTSPRSPANTGVGRAEQRAATPVFGRADRRSSRSVSTRIVPIRPSITGRSLPPPRAPRPAPPSAGPPSWRQARERRRTLG